MTQNTHITSPGIIIWAVLLCLTVQQGSAYPPSENFNSADSDPQAIAIADKVMQKLGGWENWNNTRYISWKFFGRRLHVWDKHTGNIRVEAPKISVLMNIHSKKGRAWKNNIEITDTDSLTKYLNKGYRFWVNDSYWLVMPYKLKDSGVTLKYVGEDTTAGGADAHIVQLTFKAVGVTPQNKYHVYVGKESGLVEQWAFFRDAADDKPRSIAPWQNWVRYGNILLSDKRGKRGHTDIAVFDELPAAVFESSEPVDLKRIPQAGH